jgi:hypothetical protein
VTAEELGVRLARVEEQVRAAADAERDAKLAREDLNQSLQIMQVTVSTLSTNLAHLQGTVNGILSSQQWLNRLVIGLIITLLLTFFVGGVLGHIRVQ